MVILPHIAIFISDKITRMLIIRVHSESLAIMENVSLNLEKRSMLSTNFTTSGALSVASISCPHTVFMAYHAVTQRIIGHSEPKKTPFFHTRFSLPFITRPFTFVDILNSPDESDLGGLEVNFERLPEQIITFSEKVLFISFPSSV